MPSPESSQAMTTRFMPHTTSRAPLLLLAGALGCLQGCLLFSTPEGDGGEDAPAVDVSVVVFDRGDMNEGSSQDMSPLADMLEDLSDASMREPGGDEEDMVDMGTEVITPPGWWDGRWTMRHTITSSIDWQEEIVLPVRLSGGVSAHAGKELVLFLNDSDEPLAHEIEKWSAATENVVWIRFPEGVRDGDEITIYSHTDAAPATSTERPGDVWRGLARHVYHFDDTDPSISYDSVADNPIHLIKSGGYTAALPSAKMGRHLILTEETPNIFSNGTISPLYMADDQDTTYEAHFSLPAFLEDTNHRIISDENACYGNSIIIGPDVSFTRIVHGEGCGAEGFPDPDGAQTVLHNTYRLDEPYLLFAIFDWTVMTGVTYINERHTTSNTITIPRYTKGTRAIPKRMDIGGAPWHDKQVPLAIDTLIIHDRALTTEERTLRQRVTHDNASAFALKTSEHLEDFLVK